MENKRVRVLIVEDNVTLEGEPLAYSLKKTGYEVVGIAETEKDAFQAALREPEDAKLIEALGALADATPQAKWAQPGRDELVSCDVSDTVSCLASVSRTQSLRAGVCW